MKAVYTVANIVTVSVLYVLDGMVQPRPAETFGITYIMKLQL
jgi:hypothetical protein